MMLVTDEVLLRRPCESVRNTREGGVIARKLWAALERFRLGVGLAAPQIGIHKQVCVIRAGSPIVLMNPRVVERSDQRIPFVESCLSMPGKKVNTYRHIWVSVETDNLATPVVFGPRSPEEWNANAILRSVVAQHEIAHLFGLLMTDFTEDDEVVYPCLNPMQWGAVFRPTP